jgi:hypothetical protein
MFVYTSTPSYAFMVLNELSTGKVARRPFGSFHVRELRRVRRVRSLEWEVGRPVVGKSI